jgi:hypothetical protein
VRTLERALELARREPRLAAGLESKIEAALAGLGE